MKQICNYLLIPLILVFTIFVGCESDNEDTVETRSVQTRFKYFENRSINGQVTLVASLATQNSPLRYKDHSFRTEDGVLMVTETNKEVLPADEVVTDYPQLISPSEDPEKLQQFSNNFGGNDVLIITYNGSLSTSEKLNLFVTFEDVNGKSEVQEYEIR